MADIVNQAQTRVTVDGQQASSELTALEKKARKFKDQMIAANNAGDTKAYDKAKRGLKEVDKEMRTVLRSSYDVNKVLSNLSTSGPKQLKAALSALNKELNSGKIARGSKEWDVLNGKIKLVRTEIAKLNSEQNLTQSGWQKFTGGFNRSIAVIGGLLASVTGLSFAFRKLSEDVAKMDDVYADVMKTTGMTRDQVVDLNEEFKRMDTRTSREQLNMLARDAGKLGLTAKEDILGFVVAANQIDVALGEDLGEGAIKDIGKIADVFKLSTKELNSLDLEGRMLAVGSAINELGATSSANEGYLVSFSGRLGGIAAQAGLSIQNILGYGSALDQNMQAVEMSATAFQKLIMSMLSEPAKFAKIAQMSLKDFNKLLKEDTNEALLTVLEKLGKKGGLQQLIPVFKDMGLDAARAAQVVSSLASNVDKIREAQKTSNQAFAEGTSLTNEYNTKNNNLQATLEKARKEFKDAALDLGERLNPAMMKSTNYMTSLVKLLPGVIDLFSKYGKYILYLVAAIGSYIAILKIQTALEKLSTAALLAKQLILTKSTTALILNGRALAAGTVLQKSYAAASYLVAAAKALLAGNVAKATVAMRGFMAVISINPFVALLVALPLMFKGIAMLNEKLSSNGKEIERLKEKNRQVREETEKYNSEVAKEHTALTGLITAITKTNEGTEYRKTLIKDLVTQYPNLLKYIDTEKISNEKLLAVLRLVNAEYDKKYQIAALQGLTDVEDKEIITAKQRQQQIKEIQDLINKGYTLNSAVVKDALDKLNEGNGWLSNDIDTQKELGDEYNHLASIISKSTEKVSGYRQEINKLQTDANKMNTYEGVQELLTKKSVELENQRESVQAFMDSPNLSEKSKKAMIERLKEIEAEYDVLADKLEGMQNERGANSPTGDKTPTAPSGSTDKTAVQRKKVNDALTKLEKDNNDELTKIHKQFRDGEIKSESDYNNRLLEQQNKYDESRKKKLNDLLSKKGGITDASIREDIEKQVSEIDRKGLEREVKRQADLKKILLSADPAAAEKEAYENRLRELGLFGVDRQKLTKDQLAALELLEKQHNEKMSKIERPEVLQQLKKLNEDQANEEQKRASLRAKGLLSEQQYQHELILIDIAYTAQKLQLEGLTEEQRIQLQRESFEKQKKLYEENAEIMERLNKGKKIENLADAQAGELALLDALFDQELRKTDAYEQARLAIIQKYSLLEEEQNKEKRQRMIEVAQFSLDSLQTLLSSYSSYIQAANDAETAAIKKKYDVQIKAAGNNSKQVKKLEDQRDKELEEVNRKNEERSFKIQIAQAIASTAMSAINAYSSAAAIPVIGFTLAPIAAGVAVAAGMLQVAAIKKQHEAAMANYADGGFTGPGGKYDVAGYVHRGEFVITQEALANPEVRSYVDIIDIAQRNNTVSSLKTSDFATAMEYRERVAFSPSINTMASEQERQQQSDYLVAVLGQVVDALALVNKRFAGPIYAKNYVKGPYGMEDTFKLAEKMDKNVKRS